jgi:nitrogen regulatory protein P-II 1
METLTQTGVATMKKLEILIKPGKLDAVKKALTTAGYQGVTISQAEGHGNQKGLVHNGGYRMELLPKIRMEVVIASKDLESIISAVCGAAQTGEKGDGKIFVSDVSEVIRIRTGERGEVAI